MWDGRSKCYGAAEMQRSTRNSFSPDIEYFAAFPPPSPPGLPHAPPPPRPLPDARRGSRSRREDSRVGTTSRHGTREAHQHHEVKEGKKESSVRGKLFKDVVKQGCGGSETTSCLFGSVCKTTDW